MHVTNPHLHLLQCAASSWSDLPAPAHYRAQQPASAPSGAQSPPGTCGRPPSMRAVLSRICSVAASPGSLASSGPTICTMGLPRSLAALASQTATCDDGSTQARV